MSSRRRFLTTFLGGMAIMTVPGAGGQQERPFNAPAGQATPIGIQPGVSGQVIRARLIIVSGPGEGVYSYSSNPPAFGTLISSTGVAQAGTDPGNLGNAVLAGDTSYSGSGSSWFATSLQSAQIVFYTASSPAGPWSQQSAVFFNAAASELALSSGKTFVNSAVLEAAGELQVDGILVVQGVSATLNGSATATCPISSAGVTTVAQVVSLLKQVGVFS